MPGKKRQRHKKERSLGQELLQSGIVLGCNSILHNIFGYLKKAIGLLNLEVESHHAPHAFGALGLARRAGQICDLVESQIRVKKAYRELFSVPQAADKAFTELLDIVSRLRALAEKLRTAGDRSDKDALQEISRAKPRIRQLVQRIDEQITAVETLIHAELTCVGGASAHAGEVILHEVRTVVSIDMVAYGKMSKLIEDVSFEDAAATLAFNDGINHLLQKSLKDSKVNPQLVPSIGTGDGGIFFFKKANEAAKFALKIRENTDAINRKNHGTDKNFRVGICSGKICLRESRTADGHLLRFDAGGAVIARAVRIQTACKPGDIIVCRETFVRMGPKLSSHFSQDVWVHGKSHEKMKFRAHKSSSH